jgi:hypothetical protein
MHHKQVTCWARNAVLQRQAGQSVQVRWIKLLAQPLALSDRRRAITVAGRKVLVDGRADEILVRIPEHECPPTLAQ